MSQEFQYDVFLSHSAKDKAVVGPLAERLRQAKLNVWFDEWVLKPGDNIPAKIEEGLEHSRVLVLCMSVNAFDSDWAQLEAQTFRFRDPLNRERRFIPVRLDNTQIKGSLGQFVSIDWRTEQREQEYPKLLKGCGSSELWPPLSTLGIRAIHSSCYETLDLTINDARARFQFLGVSAQFVETAKHFREKLAEKTTCRFEFLFLSPDPDNPGTIDHARREQRQVSELCAHIVAGSSLLADLRNQHGVNVELRYYDDLPDFRLIILNEAVCYVGYYGCEHHQGIDLPQMVVARTPGGMFTPFNTLWETRWRLGKCPWHSLAGSNCGPGL